MLLFCWSLFSRRSGMEAKWKIPLKETCEDRNIGAPIVDFYLNDTDIWTIIHILTSQPSKSLISIKQVSETLKITAR